MADKFFCPLLNNDCKGEACMFYVIAKGVALGCAVNVTAKQLDKLAFYMKPKQEYRQESEELKQNF